MLSFAPPSGEASPDEGPERMPLPSEPMARRAAHSRHLAGWGALLIAALGACADRYARAPRCAPGAAAEAPQRGSLRDSERIPVGDAPRAGPSDAPVTVVVFSDFECPHCARGRVVAADLRAMFPTEVRVVWRNLPSASHGHARMAAEAAMEVRAQRGDDAFWRFHDIVFANQDALGREDLERYAERVGADLPRLRAALQDHLHASAIDGDVALAERLGVDATPTFVVNGTTIAGAQPLSVFEELTVAVLRRARAVPDPREVYAAMVDDPLPAPARPSRGARESWERVHGVSVPADAPSLGARDAPVVMQVFSDFECGFCARVQPTIAALREHFAGRLRVVWRDLPLSRHPNAMRAAEAAREVRAQRGDEAFWRFHDLLFARQDALEAADLERYAVEVGADAARLRVAWADRRHAPGVQADIAAANASGLRLGTPAFFINGHFMAGARPFEEFRTRIASLLSSTAP